VNEPNTWLTVKRKRTVCVLLLCLVALAVWLAWPRDPINRATYQKIQLGMTLAEVESIVGCPSCGIVEMMDALFKTGRRRWRDPKPESILHDGNDWSNDRKNLDRIRCWEGAHAGLAVQLGDDGRVIGKHLEGRPAAGWVDSLWRALGW
jgi:hypothetical protein